MPEQAPGEAKDCRAMANVKQSARVSGDAVVVTGISVEKLTILDNSLG